MAKQEVSSVHKHPLLPFTRLVSTMCEGCGLNGHMYGGYRCNELGCIDAVFHKECGEALPEINHPSHLDHPLKLFSHDVEYFCSLCGGWGSPFGYSCSICDFKLDMVCATQSTPLAILVKPARTSIHLNSAILPSLLMTTCPQEIANCVIIHVITTDTSICVFSANCTFM